MIAIRDTAWPDVLRDHFDLALFASGYEPRCVAVQKELQPSMFRNVAVLGFQELSDTEERIDHDAVYRSRWSTEPTVSSGESELEMFGVLNALNWDGIDCARILCDYSSMSRIWYTALLNWLLLSGRVPAAEVTFSYSRGAYEGMRESLAIEGISVLPSLEGVPLGVRPSAVVLGLGLDHLAAHCLWDQIEAGRAVAWVPTGGAAEYEAEIRNRNFELLRDRKIEHVAELPISSVERSYRLLAEIISELRVENEVTIVPMGSKPHVLASILLALRFKDLSCMRISVTRQAPERVRSTGEFICSRVSLRAIGT